MGKKSGDFRQFELISSQNKVDAWPTGWIISVSVALGKKGIYWSLNPPAWETWGCHNTIGAKPGALPATCVMLSIPSMRPWDRVYWKRILLARNI